MKTDRQTDKMTDKKTETGRHKEGIGYLSSNLNLMVLVGIKSFYKFFIAASPL